VWKKISVSTLNKSATGEVDGDFFHITMCIESNHCFIFLYFLIKKKHNYQRYHFLKLFYFSYKIVYFIIIFFPSSCISKSSFFSLFFSPPKNLRGTIHLMGLVLWLLLPTALKALATHFSIAKWNY